MDYAHDHQRAEHMAVATSMATQQQSQGTRLLERTDSIDRSNMLSLDNIRQSLIRQEDSIIFSLIERSQFAHNMPVYEADNVLVPGYAESGRRYSLLEYLLQETEQLHGKIRRYTSPDEHPFFPGALPPLVLPPLTYSEVLAPCARSININPKIMSLYLNHLLPAVTTADDDGNYGSCATYDVLALQALSKRIHYGKFVAEAKFLARTADYTRLIEAGDAEGLMRMLTDERVEALVVERVRQKAAMYGCDPAPPSEDGIHSEADGDVWPACASYKVNPNLVAELYDRWVMPLTKEVQVAYLLRRLDGSAA
ncbi:hypothetical protein WJX81_007337 [Elliptochloris bilobata]|uniref:Chorismate mutase n=1 Tax=Elliptochloris bilobata TaxID=381761 RepID=A0AAW1RUV7_9CHLO